MVALLVTTTTLMVQARRQHPWRAAFHRGSAAAFADVAAVGSSSRRCRRNCGTVRTNECVLPAAAAVTAAMAARRFRASSKLSAASSSTTITSFDDGTRPFQITTPIYYVNDKPHIGHAYTSTGA